MLDALYHTRLQRLAYSAALICASAVYVRVIVHNCRPGWFRLLSALPVLLCNLYLPTLFCTPPDVVICSLACLCQLWLSNLKVLAMCFQRGSLCNLCSPVQFLAIFAAPVTPSENSHRRRGSDVQTSQSRTVGQLLTKSTIWLALTYMLPPFSSSLPRVLLQLAQAVSIYTFIGFIYDGLKVFLAQTISLRIAPQFDNPYLAESMSSFWGKRWNLPMGICLREAIYEPICEGEVMRSDSPNKGIKPSSAKRLVALCTSFAVSGVAHEVMFWYMMGFHTPRWKWLCFFSVQGPLIAAERVSRKALQHRSMHIPAWLSVPMTLGVLLLTADALFFPVWYETGFADRVNGAIQDDLQSIMYTVSNWQSQLFG